jgi:heme-degrading monooxygenase HmoA
MIFEIAAIEVKQGLEEEFERRVAEALGLFCRAKGYRSLSLERSIEAPSRYLLMVGWDNIDDHLVGFRESQDFQAWRALVGHLFAAPPRVEHVVTVLNEKEAAGHPV